jgi:hypothetical protein
MNQIMKKITLVLITLFSLFSVADSFAQKVVIVGMNHISGGAGDDGFTFVATEFIPAGEVIYFTNNEYDDLANAFTFNLAPTGEAVIRYVVGGFGLATGEVVHMNESGGSNIFTITCSSGNCGSYTVSTTFGNGSFNLATNGDGLYAYSDTDENVVNGITTIYSVMYTGSGEAPTQNGGNIPVNNSPIGDYPTSVVVDGFPDDGDFFLGPDRVEFGFSPATLRDGVSQTGLENPTNYLSYVGQILLSTVPFTNLNLAGANPVITVAASPTSVNENSGTGMVYTFTLDTPAVGPITANFSVGGTATFTGDYTQSGAASYSGASGTVVIPNAATTATVTLTPVGDTTLEPDETAVLTLTAGTGYDAGSPSTATGTILNDDTLAITPLVAVTGGLHTLGGTEGFSFVALDDISAGTEVFFTDNAFDNSLLVFASVGTDAVLRWIAPAGGVLRGEVIVAMESAPNTLITFCSSGGPCGVVTVISGVFDYATNGEEMFAYSDSDTNPTNGITAISSVLFTGTSAVPGGNIPAGQDPSGIYIGSVVVDGFPAVPALRTEYRFALNERGVTVDQANFQNKSNWLHAAPVGFLNVTPFANIIIATGSANPSLSVTVAPTTTVEDSGTAMVYTFLLDAPAVGNITVNFSVTGTAAFTTDYTQTGAATFNATTGTAVILNGNNSVAVTLTPVVDTVVEPSETVELMITSGTGYDGGSPNGATGTITNDDTSNSDPLVAITGMNHVTPDGFSFVAAKDIPAGSLIYFTENAFDSTTLLFGTGEAVLAYTSPGAVIPAGEVIVIKETTPDVFSLTCNGSTGAPCGSIVLISNNLAHDTLGETLYAYQDSDNDPSNGVDDIYAVLFTGLSAGPSGGNIPASQDPSGIYLSALVVDGFPASAPSRTEYRFALGERGIAVGQADFENAANWLHGQPNVDLSPIPFANLNILITFTAPADLCIDAGDQTGLGGGRPDGGVYAGPGVTDGGDGMTYSFDPAAAGAGVHTLSYTSGGTTVTDDIEVFALPVVAFTALADLCVDAGVQAAVGGGSPTGGVYSGPGVTDDGNGMTYSFDPAAAGVGTHTITYDFTDGNGCSGSASDDVAVFALPTVTFTAPADLCIDAGVQAGQGGGTPTGGLYSGSGVTDAGNGMTYSFDPALAGVGVHTITYTFNDTNGCSGSANDTIEVFALPTVMFTALADICLDAGVQAGLGGGTPPQGTVAGDLGVYSGPGVTDDGNGMTYSFDPAAAGVGVHVLTYTYTDDNVCSASASDNVAVFALPVVAFTALADLCVDAGVQFAIGGGSPTGGVYSGPGVTDDRNGMTYSFDPAVAGIGTHTITYVFTDGNGCSGSASDDVAVFALPTVTFTAPASPVCPTLVLTGQGGGTPTGGVYSGPGVTDDGNGMTYTFDTNVSGIGTHTITYTFTDGNGCTASASDTVTVEDNDPPVITCPADITVDNDPGECGAIVTFAATATDNCPSTVIITYSQNPGTQFPVGTTVVTATATDASGNTDTCTFDVTVSDTEDPVVLCPANITVSNNPGQCDAVVTFMNSATDNCPGVITSSVPASGSVFPVGTTTVTVTATDASGNTATCSFDVTVNDTEDPVITCPGNISVNNDPGDCGAIVTFAATATDNCSAVVTYSQDPNTSFPVGTTIVTATATDPSGNAVSCTFTVTVTDNEPPVAVCMDITVQLNAAGTASIVAGDIDGGSTDNCGIASLAITPSTFTCADVGANTVTLTVTDVNGNSSSCTATVTVEDNVPPVALCQNITIQLDANGDASIVAADVDGGSTDACGIASIAIDIDTFTCADVGPNSVTLTVTDNNENMSSCVAIVTVVDDILPTITCPADVTIGTDADICGALVFFPDPLDANDNCGVVSVVQTAGFTSGSAFPTGVTTNTFLVTDVNGNTGTCSFTVTVTDDDAPITLCLDITIQLDAAGNATIVPGDVDGGSSDNCGIVSTTIDIDTFTCADLGPNDVTLTATDAEGNSSSCIAVVTVEDITAPVAVCQDITVQLDALGVVTIDPSSLDGGSTDSCGDGVFTYSAAPDTFDCSNVGTNTVTLTVTDSNGNSSTCTATVTVEDTVAPTISCMDLTVSLDENGTATIIADDLIVGFDDACGLGTTSVDIDTFDCDDVGAPVTVTVTATDANGNTVTCTATVTVLDELGPQFESGSLPADEVRFADENGEYILEDFTQDVTVTDNCSVLDAVIVLDQDPAIGTVLTVGVYDITLSAEDDLGNITEYIFELEVVQALSVGENSFDTSSLTLYPNPATDFIVLSNPQSIPLKEVTIYDVTGRLIKKLDASQVISEMRIDTSELASATYMILINTDAGQVAKQLVKE